MGGAEPEGQMMLHLRKTNKPQIHRSGNNSKHLCANIHEVDKSCTFCSGTFKTGVGFECRHRLLQCGILDFCIRCGKTTRPPAPPYGQSLTQQGSNQCIFLLLFAFVTEPQRLPWSTIQSYSPFLPTKITLPPPPPSTKKNKIFALV